MPTNPETIFYDVPFLPGVRWPLYDLTQISQDSLSGSTSTSGSYFDCAYMHLSGTQGSDAYSLGTVPISVPVSFPFYVPISVWLTSSPTTLCFGLDSAETSSSLTETARELLLCKSTCFTYVKIENSSLLGHLYFRNEVIGQFLAINPQTRTFFPCDSKVHCSAALLLLL